jgi:hypothetical protein
VNPLGRRIVATQAAITAYEDLTIELSDETGVTHTSDGLFVHGRLFAFRDDSDLVVDLSAPRAADLAAREIAAHYTAAGRPPGDWVRVSDLQLWPELAREAHEYVGEPPVGGDS